MVKQTRLARPRVDHQECQRRVIIEKGVYRNVNLHSKLCNSL